MAGRRVAGSRRRAGASTSSVTAPDTPVPAPALIAPVAPVPTPPAIEPSATGEPELLVVGRIGKPQGIRGEVTVEVRTDDPAARFADGAVLITDPVERGPLTVESSRDQNGRLVVAFAGSPDRNAAEALRDTLLQVDAATVPPPDGADEFHDHVLRGMAATLTGGEPLGEVTDVLHLPHGDVLVIATSGGREVLVPFVSAMVPEVDVAGRRLVVDPPEGLLELTAPEPVVPQEPEA